MPEDTYEGIARSKILWTPKIDYKKCISCGKCVDFCHTGTFGFEERDGKKKAVVKKPTGCIVFCRGCEDICPAVAITHPSEEKTQKIIEKLQKAKAKVK